MRRWLELSEEVFPVAEFGDDPKRLEAMLGIDDLFTTDDLTRFRACDPETVGEMTELLLHRHHRHLVKLLVFAAECVPEPLLRPLLLAGVHTINPSFNKHFVFPCVLVHGRRRVVAELIAIATEGGDEEKVGVGGALYWGAIPREHAYWPHHTGWTAYQGAPDDPVADLLACFAEWAVEEFVRNENLEVRRALVHHVASVRARVPELAQAAIEVVRCHPDPFLRDRLRHDLGESELIPCCREVIA